MALRSLPIETESEAFQEVDLCNTHPELSSLVVAITNERNRMLAEASAVQFYGTFFQKWRHARRLRRRAHLLQVMLVRISERAEELE